MVSNFPIQFCKPTFRGIRCQSIFHLKGGKAGNGYPKETDYNFHYVDNPQGCQ